MEADRRYFGISSSGLEFEFVELQPTRLIYGKVNAPRTQLIEIALRALRVRRRYCFALVSVKYY